MSYEMLVKETQSLTETEKFDLVTVILGSLRSDLKKNDDIKNKLIFPHIKKNKPISKSAMDLVFGPLPKNFDVEKTTDEMWESFAK